MNLSVWPQEWWAVFRIFPFHVFSFRISQYNTGWNYQSDLPSDSKTTHIKASSLLKKTPQWVLLVSNCVSKDTIQNFQFCRVRFFTYSLNFSCMWSKRCRLMGTPVAGSCSWHKLWLSRGGRQIMPAAMQSVALRQMVEMLTYLIEVLSSSISSRSLLTSSCICCLSCWSFPMCSTVFCSVTALLI